MLQLFDLPVLEFQRGRAAEDRGDDAHHSLVGDAAVLVELQLDEDVTGIELAVALAAHAALHRTNALAGDEDAPDVLFESFDLDLTGQLLLDLVFLVAGDSQDEKLHVT